MTTLPLSTPAFSLPRLTIGKWLLLLFAVALVSWGAAFHHNLSQIGLLGSGVLWFFAARRLGTAERQRLINLAGIAAGVATVGLTALNGFERLPAEPVNPNALASLLLLALPTLPWLAVALVFTQSRAAWLAAFAYYWRMIDGFINRPLFADEDNPHRKHPTRSLLVAVVLAGLVGMAVFALRPETVQARWRVWAEAAQLTTTHPLWGVGYGNYAHYAHTEPRKLHADSLPLTLLAEMGLVGGGAALFAVGAIAWRVWHTPARAALKWGLGLWLLQQTVDHTISQVAVLAVVMLALADVE